MQVMQQVTVGDWDEVIATSLSLMTHLPVSYTCEKAHFDTEGTHFDTNHLHTVIWSESDMKAAAELLTLTIRTTLPGEAKLED
ncbi:MAG TPA: hypothetical protein VKB45_19915 [Gemmatimonadales bacterium]|nr:hypothetical protein [Gemmatimonadales bacterium]